MNHLSQIAARLGTIPCDGLLITGESNEYYAVGFHGEGFVLITPTQNYYSTDSRYIEAAAAIENVELTMVTREKNHLALLVDHVSAHNLKVLGFEDATMSVALYNKIRKALPDTVELVPASALLDELRAVKDEDELNMIRMAQAITDQTFEEILNDIKVGVTEAAIAARLSYLQKCHGASGDSFDPIVASGANGSMPHAIPTDKPLAAGEFITMDFGCKYGGYCSDMTRTVCLGTPTDEMRWVYDTVLKAQMAGIARIRSGVTGAEVHNAAADWITAAGYGPYFGHGFGHSVGIDIHESPSASPANTKPIPAGAILSAEPGIYLPGRFGVRIEDLTIYRPEGCENITTSRKDLICLPV
ncbi:MAG: Xaa-Pro peptidase family protein [Lachnospiraceae bacterium]|nr:Xaa-Pro peptidase family protein [Lachnospiraceae bacterium]